MSETLNIYGTVITLPEIPEVVENWGTDNPKEQYWRRKEIPDFFELVDFDKEGNALLNKEQWEYAQEEVRRCKEGFWFLNNGIPTYITGKNYFYFQWWKLEDDIYPHYRDTIRRSFLHLDYWENQVWCLGRMRGKKRREGASSEASSNLIYECIFFRNSFCGLVSKTEKDGKTTFTNMVSFGYRQLPVFLKPKQLNNKDSVSELVFAHKSVETKGTKGSVIDTDTGHRSKVDFRAPGKNAYDSGRLSRGLFDEGGKWEKENPFSSFISIVSKTLVKGARRVGFIECPSTVNEMTKSGGNEYKKVWDNADQLKNDRTPNRLVRYFTPAYDGYEGFIDQYGMSVIDGPTDEQYDYLVSKYVGVTELTKEDIALGAKAYLLNKRKQLSGADLEEEIRMNPFDEREMFLSSLIGCLFNAFKINEQLDYLTYAPKLTERGNLIWENGDEFYKETIRDGQKEIKISRLIWVQNDNGVFEKVIGWLPKEMNNVYMHNGNFHPNGNYSMRVACDPFKYDKTKDIRKSDCAAYGYQMADPLKEDDPFNDMFTIRFFGRPPTTDIQYENVLKLAWFCGCQVLIERNIGLEPKKYFINKKCFGFLTYLPGEVEYGIYTDSANNVVQAGCGYTESYIEKNISKVYWPELMSAESGWLGFEVDNTQKYDHAMCGHFVFIAGKLKNYIKQDSKNKDIQSVLPIRKAS